MANLYNKNDQPISVNFIHNAIITGSNFMKIVVSFQFGCGWVRKIIAEFINFFLNAQQFTFW